MKFFLWARNHGRSILFLFSVLALGGLATSLVLPVSLFPNVSFPRIVLELDAGDRPAERMAAEVTYRTEEALRSVPGVRSLRSTTSRGSAEISIDFDWGQDMSLALLQAESQVNKILPTLPPGTTFDIQRRDPTVFPVIAYSLTSDKLSSAQLYDIAQYQLRPVLSTVLGVAKVDVQGGDVAEYRVEIDPAKLQSFGLSIATVADALNAANVLSAVGHLEDHDKLYLVISDTHFQTAEQIGQTIVRSGENGIVRLDQIASIRPDAQPQFVRVTADGKSAVLFQVFQQPGGNTVQIAGGVKKALDGFRDKIPADVKIANWYDQSDLIVASATSVRDAILIGVALAAVVLMLFLRNWKVSLLAMLSVPAALATTILLLHVAGMSFNIMTLGGMAAAVGLIVDDAIVMVEQIIRRLHGDEGDWQHRIVNAAAEFSKPLAGSSASTIIIFVPLAFLGGVTGAFFKALSLTMASSLVISFLIAWLGVPIAAAHILGVKDTKPHDGGFIARAILAGYRGIMGFILPRAWIVLPFILGFMAIGYFAYLSVGRGFMPSMDEGGFILDYVAPAGTSLAETDRLLRQVEAVLRSTDEVQTYSRRTGLQLGGGLTEANTGDFFVRLKPLPRRTIEDVMTDVRNRVQASVPGLDIETAQLMEDLIGDLTAVPQPIEILLFCDDEKTLRDLGPKVADAISKDKHIVEVKNGITAAGDALNVQIDPVKASLEGMDVDDITKQLNDMLSGNVATQIQEGPKLVGVRVWLPEKTQRTVPDVGQLLIKAPNGHVFPLKRVAAITAETGQPEINRQDLKRMIAVTARIENSDLGSAAAKVDAILKQPGLIPNNVYYKLGGLYEQQQIAFRGLMIVLAAAIVLVFGLLLFLYESFRVAVAMMLMPLFAMSAVFAGLWLTGTELNITAMMGMTMIVGIVTEVAIFYYSELQDLPKTQKPIDRLILAGVNRMRPIAMTTLAAILALMPLAVGFGQGSAMQKPLAIAIISGLIVQLPLVLIVMPALLAILRTTKTA